MTENALAHETSPYLLQHKDNPVHWRPWGAEALETARREDKPILLSVGYAACHWCHVMAHESFEDDETARVMNEGFVNIKVDREERPDVDSIYQSALALIGEQGGWPLTMFLMPDGRPFWGGTYFPLTPRFGRPAFRDVLLKVLDVYRGEKEKVRLNASTLTDALDRISRAQAGGAIPPNLLADAARRLLPAVDSVHGGLGRAPKFPQTPLFETLWRGHKVVEDAMLGEAVQLTLDRMSLGGIYDHLGGGFARYATDDRWLVPHFEKMLYDNALLVDLLQLVWQDTRSPLYAARVAETIAWMLRDMGVPGGGFASSFDADSEGVEGKFYVWSAREIDEVLGPDSELFKAAYGVTREGNWEGHNILNRQPPVFRDADLEARLERARSKLLARRDTRVKPGRDDKVLADWNGFAITALARAGASFDRLDWIDAAKGAYGFIRKNFRKDGRLLHSWRAGRARHPATLDDHASLARAALALFEATAEAAYLEQAKALVADADAHYWDAKGGGYFLTADDTPDLITRTKSGHDGATPSGNGMMTEVLARLYYLTGEERFAARAQAVIGSFSGDMTKQFYSVPTLVNAADLLEGAVEIVVMAPKDGDSAAALQRAVYAASVPNRIVQTIGAGAALPANHPAHGRGPVDGKATAYVCTAGTCSLPVTDALTLATMLGAPVAETRAKTGAGPA